MGPWTTRKKGFLGRRSTRWLRAHTGQTERTALKGVPSQAAPLAEFKVLVSNEGRELELRVVCAGELAAFALDQVCPGLRGGPPRPRWLRAVDKGGSHHPGALGAIIKSSGPWTPPRRGSRTRC